MFFVVLSLFILALSVYLYAKYVEPRFVSWKTLTIKSPQIPKSFHRFKMIHITDTHLGFSYQLRQFQKHIHVINKRQPNVVFFTGDLTDRPNGFNEQQQLIETLRKIIAPQGKYAVIGNHDYLDKQQYFFQCTMHKSGFQILNNQATEINNGSEAHIVIAGVEDPIFSKPDIQQALHTYTTDTFNILLSHVPDIAFTDPRIHLQLSGHTHGGQINIPCLGAVVTPTFGKKYVKGLYTNEHNQLLYVNKGLGTTRMPLRFFCQPEIVEIILVHGSADSPR